MAYVLTMIMRIVLATGAISGLGMCLYSSVHSDWPIAFISFAVYAFSLVMLS
jgi:hypothetical protein